MKPDQGPQRRAGLSVVLLAALLAAGYGATERRAFAQSEVSAESRRVRVDSRPDRVALEQSVARALEYLRREHSKSGDEYRGFLRSPFPVATTSLAGLAILASGVLPGEGEHGDQLVGCVNFILEVARRDAFLTEADGDDQSGSRMHGHCYAVLFLTQVAGSLPAQREAQVSSVIRSGIRVIQNAQSRDGGWYYWAKNSSDEDEASVTICALQALRAARDAGYLVDSARIDSAIRYVKRCQNADGSVRYQLRGGPQRSTFALTAAAVSTLNAAGVYRSDELSRGLDFLKKELRAAGSNPLLAVVDTYFYYGNFYTAQALWQERGSEWDAWYAEARTRLQRRQKRDGNWESPFGDVYATAMSLLILQMPVGYLPMFER